MIPVGDPRKTPPVRKGDITPTDRAAVRRAEMTVEAFPGRQARGLSLDLSQPAKTMETDGFGSTLALYDPGYVSDLARRDEAHDRFARLPAPIQRAAQAKGLADITMLEIGGILHRKSQTMGGERVQVFASDIAKAIAITTLRAEQLIDEAVRNGLIERTGHAPGGGFFRTAL